MGINDKYSEIYNNAYRFVTPDFLAPENEKTLAAYLKRNNDSLLQFLTQFFSDKGGLGALAEKDILEAGCGLGGISHFLANINANVLGVDISELAVSAANQIALQNKSTAGFKCADLTTAISLDKKYDYIIDSHLLHCLTSNEQRSSYFDFVKKHLKESGVFIVETATFEDEIREPLGYEIDQDYILHQRIGSENIPIRKLSTARQLEDELKAHGFVIHTFFYHYELSFNVFPEVRDYPTFRLPKTVRYTVRVP